MREFKVNERLRHWTFLEEIDRVVKNGQKHRQFKVRCDCGEEKVVTWTSLVVNKTRYCTECFPRGNNSRNGPVQGANPNERRAFNSISSTARKHGRDFLISFDDFLRLSAKNCNYCDSGPSNVVWAKVQQGKNKGQYRAAAPFFYSGLDRVDSSLGYTLDNVVPCCKMCNIAKNNHSLEDFLQWAERLYRNSIMKDA